MNYGDEIALGTACFPGQGGVKSKGELRVNTNKRAPKSAKMAPFTGLLHGIERNCETFAAAPPHVPYLRLA